MGIEDEHPALTLPPLFDVLADQVFKKLGLAGARAATDVQVLIARGTREEERRVPARQDAEVEVVAGGEAHSLNRC